MAVGLSATSAAPAAAALNWAIKDGLGQVSTQPQANAGRYIYVFSFISIYSRLPAYVRARAGVRACARAPVRPAAGRDSLFGGGEHALRRGPQALADGLGLRDERLLAARDGRPARPGALRTARGYRTAPCRTAPCRTTRLSHAHTHIAHASHTQERNARGASSPLHLWLFLCCLPAVTFCQVLPTLARTFAGWRPPRPRHRCTSPSRAGTTSPTSPPSQSRRYGTARHGARHGGQDRTGQDRAWSGEGGARSARRRQAACARQGSERRAKQRTEQAARTAAGD